MLVAAVMQDDEGWTVSAVPDDYRVEKASQVRLMFLLHTQLAASLPPGLADHLLLTFLNSSHVVGHCVGQS